MVKPVELFGKEFDYEEANMDRIQMCKQYPDKAVLIALRPSIATIGDLWNKILTIEAQCPTKFAIEEEPQLIANFFLTPGPTPQEYINFVKTRMAITSKLHGTPSKRIETENGVMWKSKSMKYDCRINVFVMGESSGF